MDSPLVSIIVPCYKIEKYIDRCVHSIINQSLSNIEVILVDDGSPDNVPLLCDAWAVKDKRIKVLHKKNGGLGEARNSGMDLATGMYIAFVDGDDYVASSMYEHLVNIAITHQADAVFCGFRKEVKPDVWINVNEVRDAKIFVGKNISEIVLGMIANPPYVKRERSYEISVWHSIYKRDLINRYSIRFASEREIASEDLPFNIDFLLHALKVVFLPNIYYNYCLNETSLTATFIPEKYERMKSLYIMIKEKCKTIDNNYLCSNRFFIGYVRGYILHLQKSDRKDKIDILKHVVNDDVWRHISKSYKPHFLPFYQRLFYHLLLTKQTFLLQQLAKFVNIAKIIANKR